MHSRRGTGAPTVGRGITGTAARLTRRMERRTSCIPALRVIARSGLTARSTRSPLMTLIWWR